jgi:hypothetical protein
MEPSIFWHTSEKRCWFIPAFLPQRSSPVEFCETMMVHKMNLRWIGRV